MKRRLILYVLWEKNGEVRDFVAYSLEQFRAFAGDVLVIANGGLSECGRRRLDAIGVRYIERENTGLDFAAWKAAMEREGWEKLTALDELVLANCSCYGPIFPLQEVFERMEPDACDFWGMTRHPDADINVIAEDPDTRIVSHLQSYFMVFRQSAIRSECFRRWWETLVPAAAYWEEVGYHEVPFTRYLEQGGLRAATYYADARSVDVNPTLFADVEQVRERRVPFIKVKMFHDFLPYYARVERTDIPWRLAELMEKHTAYPTEIVWRNIVEEAAEKTFRTRPGSGNEAAVVQLSFDGEHMMLLLDAPAGQLVSAYCGSKMYKSMQCVESEHVAGGAVAPRQLLIFELPLTLNRWVTFRLAEGPLPLRLAAPWNMAQRYLLLRGNRLKMSNRTGYLRALSLSSCAPALWRLWHRVAHAPKNVVLFVETGLPNRALRALALAAAAKGVLVRFLSLCLPPEALPLRLRECAISYAPAAFAKQACKASFVVCDGVLPPCDIQECLYPMLRARVVLAYPQTAELLRDGRMGQLLYQKPDAVFAESAEETRRYGDFLDCSYQAFAPADAAEKLLPSLLEIITPASSETLQRLTELGLPENAYYLRCHPEIALAKQSPLLHYAERGWVLGYAPCAASFYGKESTRRTPHLHTVAPLSQILADLSSEAEIPTLSLNFDSAAPSVLLVSHLLDYSGAPVALLSLVEPLQRMGWAVIVLSPVDGPLRQAFEQKGCCVRIEPRPQDIAPQAFRRMGVELCICNTVVMSTCFIAYSAVLPSLLWIHENMMPPTEARKREFLFTRNKSLFGWESATYGIMNPRLLQALQPLQKRVAFCSDVARTPFRDLLPDSFPMPYIVRDQAEVEETARPSPRGGDVVHFVFIGSFNQRKSPHLIVEALALMPPQLRRRCRISLVGRPAVPDTYALQLEALAAPFAEVQLLSAMEPQDVQRFYKTVDVLLCPSQTDPLPLVVTEAWMNGCAVVMSEGVGQRDLAETGESRNAYVVPVGDAAALAAVMRHLAEHTEELPLLSQNARRTYCRHFDAATTARRWMDLAAQLRAQPSKAPSN